MVSLKEIEASRIHIQKKIIGSGEHKACAWGRHGGAGEKRPHTGQRAGRQMPRWPGIWVCKGQGKVRKFRWRGEGPTVCPCLLLLGPRQSGKSMGGCGCEAAGCAVAIKALAWLHGRRSCRAAVRSSSV